MTTKKRFMFILLTLVLAMSLLSGCGGTAEEPASEVPPPEPQEILAERTFNELGFSMSYSADFYPMSAVEVSEAPVYDSGAAMNKTIVTLLGVFEGVRVPLAEISIYDGIFEEEALETINPLAIYIGTENEWTYTLQYSEEGAGLLTEVQLPLYEDVMNNYIVGLDERIELFMAGTRPEAEPPAELSPEILEYILQDATPTDLEADPEDSVTEE